MHNSSRYNKRRSRSHSSGPAVRRAREDESTKDILNKFIDLLGGMKGHSSSKLTVNNVVPEFDPISKEQTIVNWLTKVEECAEIYGWNE